MKPVMETGWYGKIPVAGDFVHRRLPRNVIAAWDLWLQGNLASHRHVGVAREGRGLADRIWNFLLPAGVGQGWVQAGCITPSTDRVGRQYALLALVLLDPADWSPVWADRLGPAYQKIGTGLRDVVSRGHTADYLDHVLLDVGHDLDLTLQPRPPAEPVLSSSSQDILDILNSGKAPEIQQEAEPEAARTHALPLQGFNAFAHTSCWWTNAQEGGAMRTYVHGGRPDSSLFNRLFVPANSARLL